MKHFLIIFASSSKSSSASTFNVCVIPAQERQFLYVTHMASWETAYASCSRQEPWAEQEVPFVLQPQDTSLLIQILLSSVNEYKSMVV